MSKPLDIVWTNQFKKDYKLAMKRHLDIALLDDIIRKLANNEQRFIWKIRKCTRHKRRAINIIQIMIIRIILTARRCIYTSSGIRGLTPLRRGV